MFNRLTQIQNHFTSNMAVVAETQKPDINLYTAQTPNGIKISMTLEELGFVGQRLLYEVCHD